MKITRSVSTQRSLFERLRLYRSWHYDAQSEMKTLQWKNAYGIPGYRQTDADHFMGPTYGSTLSFFACQKTYKTSLAYYSCEIIYKEYYKTCWLISFLNQLSFANFSSSSIQLNVHKHPFHKHFRPYPVPPLRIFAILVRKKTFWSTKQAPLKDFVALVPLKVFFPVCPFCWHLRIFTIVYLSVC